MKEYEQREDRKTERREREGETQKQIIEKWNSILNMKIVDGSSWNGTWEWYEGEQACWGSWWVYSIWKRWEREANDDMGDNNKEKTNKKCVNKADEAKAALQLQLHFQLLCLEGNGSSSLLPVPSRSSSPATGEAARRLRVCLLVCLSAVWQLP